jgi:ribosome-associated protein
MEGEETGEWVLVDLSDIVVHIMQPSIRSYYNLEELWQKAPKRATPKAAKAASAATADEE